MAKDMTDPKTEVIAETEEFMAWRAEEPDGETTFHLELNNVTLHPLESTDRLAKLNSGLGIFYRHVQQVLTATYHIGA